MVKKIIIIPIALKKTIFAFLKPCKIVNFMTCNRCGKEMTKEIRSENFSWWCPFCGNIETMYSDKNKPADEKPEKPRNP